ncbi:solute carrier family 13 (sodium-dependent dicarboxylate transporter), member 2/3/5 [Maridesulfovibrio ferrireducens]|uniref:Solute carrier family 13 (Sodium-dependent dicarboxylate transporter), member 2/3/5 n=1 Tax=Maridesulfovibrio ferrireducens TaxID=246191 RepID=A0A1G9DA31_9BACT|nr:SLC13 family permease [Maridesulfovibrio ferrireducens]SDK60731.1 solute carrier family 13 (sodium-dependent dicarboxylate transporter), member 2/3/5 [Maridesulfovibrio ferrireducens]
MSSLLYIYERAPLLLLFVTGYILYQVMASVRLPEYFSAKAVSFSRGRADYLLLSLIFVSAGMSMFIPNAVTVLAMIPVIRKLDAELESMTTPLTLSIIYGANIGGMGSLIGSPANILLIGAMDFFKVAGREQITFFNWFIWALPLVILFLLLSWFVVRFAIPKGEQAIPAKFLNRVERISIKQKRGLNIFGFFLGFWLISSVIREFLPAYAEFEPVVALIFTTVFLKLIFGKGQLMSWGSLLEGVPKRGLLLLLILGVFIVAVKLLNLDEYAAEGFKDLLTLMAVDGQRGYLLYLVTAAVVILLTEILSNTVVSTAFFAVVVHTAFSFGTNPMLLMILVSIASTCAFMTPIATPCNSLAFGEMKRVSLRSMLGLGMVLNICGAVLLSLWVWKVIPYIYR